MPLHKSCFAERQSSPFHGLYSPKVEHLASVERVTLELNRAYVEHVGSARADAYPFFPVDTFWAFAR